MNTSKASARLRGEVAIAAYLRNFYDTRADDPTFDKKQLDIACRREGVLSGLAIVEAATPVDYVLPCVVVSCPQARPVVPGDLESGMTELRVEVHVMTHLNEGEHNDAARLHAARYAEVLNLLTDDVESVMTTISGEEFPISDFTVFGAWLEDEVATQYDLHWDDTIIFMLHCNAFHSTT